MIFGAIVGFLSGQGICVEDAGYVGGAALQSTAIVHDATMWAAVQSAMMLWQRHTNSKIADIRRDLANRRMVMAESALNHAKTAWAQEKAMVADTMSTVAATPLYSKTALAADAIERSWLQTDAEFDRMSNKLGVGVTPEDDIRTSRGMAIALTDIMANVMRGEEARALMLNDRRFSRQLAVLAVGHNKLMPAIKIGQLGESSANAVRNAFTSAFNMGMSVWGYEENRYRAGDNPNWRDRFSTASRFVPVEDRSVRYEPEAPTVTETQFTAEQVESETPPI